MNNELELFFKELHNIQDFIIGFVLAQRDKYNTLEEMLEDVTYENICMICELIDGYRNDMIKYNILNVKNGEFVNEEIDLHDLCEKYLRY